MSNTQARPETEREAIYRRGRAVGLKDAEMDMYSLRRLPSVVAALEARQRAWQEQDRR